MSKHSIPAESSSNAAHKRQAVTPQDEDPLPSASSSSSLAHQASSLSTHLIADLILPFIADRSTWNTVCSASNELRRAGKKMTPPWPNKAFNVGHPVRRVAFSPSGSQLAFFINNYSTGQYVVHIWDRWGKEILLGGHTEYIYCLEYSFDWEYLASGSEDGSIRIWIRESFHSTFLNPESLRGTRRPKQADKILVGSRNSDIMALSFSRTDSNLLASGGYNGEIKLWNVNEQACIHSFNPGCGFIRSLFFTGGADLACLAATHALSIIRLWRAEGSSDFSSETIGEADRGGISAPLRAVFSPSGFFLATSLSSRTGDAVASTLASYELETMTLTQVSFLIALQCRRIANS